MSLGDGGKFLPCTTTHPIEASTHHYEWLQHLCTAAFMALRITDAVCPHKNANCIQLDTLSNMRTKKIEKALNLLANP